VEGRVQPVEDLSRRIGRGSELMTEHSLIG
jgi:hypothetical protein